MKQWGEDDLNYVLNNWGASTGPCVARNLSCPPPPPEPEPSKPGKAYAFGKDKTKKSEKTNSKNIE